MLKHGSTDEKEYYTSIRNNLSNFKSRINSNILKYSNFILYIMVHENVLVFSQTKLSEEKIEKLFYKIFIERQEDIVDAYGGISKFSYLDSDLFQNQYSKEKSKEVYFMQLYDFWKLNDNEIERNFTVYAYITIDEKYRANPHFLQVIAFAKTLSEATWICLMRIAT